MAEIQPKDIRLQFGGRVFERHGVLFVPGPYRASRHAVETVTRGSVAYFLDRDGIVRKAANNKLRLHYPGGLVGADGEPVPTVLGEGTRTNGWATNTENYNHADWTKTGVTINSNIHVAPDGVLGAADGMAESALNEEHRVARSIAGMTDNLRTTVWWVVKPAGRTWSHIRTVNKANTVRSTWFNLATGALGTKDAGHDAWIVPLGLGYYFISASFDAASGATTPVGQVLLATGDGVTAYAGDGASGIYIWESGVEVNNAFPSEPGSILPNGLARSSDVIDMPRTVDMTRDWSLFLWFIARHANVTSWSDTHPQTDPLILSLYPMSPPTDTDNSGVLLLHRQNSGGNYEWEYWINRGTASRTFNPTPAAQKLVLRHYASDHHLDIAADGSAFVAGAAPSTVTVPAGQLQLRLRSDAWLAWAYGVLADGLHTQAEFEALPGAT